MKKLLFILCVATSILAETTRIPLCPLPLLNTITDDQPLSPDALEALEKTTINDALVLLARIVEGIVILSTQPHNAARVGAQLAAIVTSIMAKTTRTTVDHQLVGTDSLACVSKILRHANIKRPKLSEEIQDRERIRDVILATFINILSNVAVITAHPHDHKLVASQATLLAANVLNAVKETVRSPLINKDYEDVEKQLEALIIMCALNK